MVAYLYQSIETERISCGAIVDPGLLPPCGGKQDRNTVSLQGQ